jgi:hypothetical protein
MREPSNKALQQTKRDVVQVAVQANLGVIESCFAAELQFSADLCWKSRV